MGRHLVTMLVKEQLASKIRVADKNIPATGWLNDEQKAIFAQVDFKQANLSSPASCERVFHDDEGAFDLVVNLAAETKYGQSEEVYKERVLNVAINCAKEAAKTGVKRFIEVSTAQVYNCDKGESSEESKLDPWTVLAKYKLKAEEALKNVPGLNYVILRPAIVYGTGDKQGLTPRLVTAACYRELHEKMKMLWTEKLQMSTVHVRDVCRAVWHLRQVGETGTVFNLADKGGTTQGTVASVVSEIFEIEHGYFGTVLSNLAKLHMASATEESNEKHLAPWSAACERDGIANTPLSPYIDQELLYNKHLHINGTKVESLGFSYEVPRVTMELLREVVDDYLACGLFPPSLVPARK